ncbi:MAG TPA: hypothetical protein VJS44_00730 [Pyrinomonadaceae bacterium]|nr:hypothetical protein [Pyrinomonadaceae bacterium]
MRERQLRSIGKAVRVEPDIAPPRVTLGQVKDDYEGLQLANNNVLNMISMGNAPDYRLIEEAASEIKKRAGRLKSYMLILQMVRENESRRKSLMDIEPAAIKESLMTLDGAIARLVDNPIFKNFNRVTDADGAIKARDELDDIIDLSEGIRRSARRALKLARASK